MNINDELKTLGGVGESSYSASDDVIAGLLKQTGRARAARQSVMAVGTSIGALVIGFGAAQVHATVTNDPAQHDITLAESTKKGDKDTKKESEPKDKDGVKDKPADKHPDKPTDQQPKPDATVDPDKSDQGSDVKPTDKPTDKPTEKPSDCVAKDHPNYPAKTWDCKKNTWVVKAGWFWDEFANDYAQCDAQNSYAGGYYDCKKGKWIINNGYFAFNQTFYQIKSFTDAATGTSHTGAFATGYEKLFFASPSKNYWDDYKYTSGKATWTGSACVGTTTVKYGANFQWSCLPEYKISVNNGSAGNVGKEWILLDTHLRWHPNLGQYANPASPPSGWVWDGSGWVVDAPPPPPPAPTPVVTPTP